MTRPALADNLLIIGYGQGKQKEIGKAQARTVKVANSALQNKEDRRRNDFPVAPAGYSANHFSRVHTRPDGQFREPR
jgi:hypothetical protein